MSDTVVLGLMVAELSDISVAPYQVPKDDPQMTAKLSNAIFVAMRLANRGQWNRARKLQFFKPVQARHRRRPLHIRSPAAPNSTVSIFCISPEVQ
jgi:hypothetical protein